jgi:Effector protein
VAPPDGDACTHAGTASTASAPRGTVQAFWVLRDGKYRWRNANDENKFVQLRGVTHSSKSHPDPTPVYAATQWGKRTKLQIEPVAEQQAANREKKLRTLRRGVIKDLKEILSTRIGERLLRYLATMSPRKTFLKPSEQGPLPETEYHLAGERMGESDIRFYPSEVYDAMELFEREKRKEHIEVGWKLIPSDVALFHELVHAYHNARDTNVSGTLPREEALNPVDIGIERREYQAVGLDTKDGVRKFSDEEFTENKYRAARTPKLPDRTTYMVPYKPESNKARRESLESESRSRSSSE